MYSIGVLVFFSKEERTNPATGVDLSLFQKLFIWLYRVLVAACGIYFLDQRSSPGPLHWEHGVLAAGPPGKSLTFSILIVSQSSIKNWKAKIFKGDCHSLSNPWLTQIGIIQSWFIYKRIMNTMDDTISRQ